MENSVTLYRLLSSIQNCIKNTYNRFYWIRAEISEVRIAQSGNVFLELIDRSDNSNSISAKARATIWRSTYSNIKCQLSSIDLELSNGMNILAQVEVAYSPEFGLNLIIHNIDPSYSLGDIARLRQETIERLKKEGVYNLNKTLKINRPLQKFAIISSPTAAGYGDFIKQLQELDPRLVCHTALFPAIMQGESTTGSVCSALDKVIELQEKYARQGIELFDAVVIIRGGGAVSELRAFDDYDLAYYCANYPLPIITGIGHDRDISVLDFIAHSSLKTPTAVASFIVRTIENEWATIMNIQERLQRSFLRLSSLRERELILLQTKLPNIVFQLTRKKKFELQNIKNRVIYTSQEKLYAYRKNQERFDNMLPLLVRNEIRKSQNKARYLQERLNIPIKNHLIRFRTQLDYLQQSINLANPKEILKKGFALIRHQGKIIKDVSELNAGEELNISLNQDNITVNIKEICNQSK